MDFLSKLGGSKAMQNLGRGFTGNAVKAVLCIREPEQAKKENNPDVKNAIGEIKGAITDVNKINTDLMEMAEASLTGKGASGTFSDVQKKLNNRKYIALEVQFNPSSLQLNTSAGMQTTYNDDATDVSVQTVRKPAATELAFELLFDDVNNQDAYMLEGNAVTNFSFGNALQAGKSAFRSKKDEDGNKGKFSVQRQMEGLLALLTLDSARHVIFFWADMSFRGEVTAVSTTYTMFNKKGYPVRGKVGMTIRQGDGSDGADEQDKMFAYNENYWDKAFDRLFKDDIKSSVSDKLSNNLVNLKL